MLPGLFSFLFYYRRTSVKGSLMWDCLSNTVDIYDSRSVWLREQLGARIIHKYHPVCGQHSANGGHAGQLQDQQGGSRENPGDNSAIRRRTCEAEEALTTDRYTLGSKPVRSEAEGDL